MSGDKRDDGPVRDSQLPDAAGVADGTLSPVPPASGPVPSSRDAVKRLRAWDLWQVGLRSLLLQALWNPERMQSQGFAYSLRPIARRLLGRDAEAAWLARQMGYFNTNPPLAGCALGVVSRVEAEEAEVCCGSGGTYSLRHRSLAEAMGRRKAERLAASGADVIVTANPGCLGQIADGLALVAPDLPIIPLTDLIWASWQLNR